MFLFIFESIGTSELILIGIIALVVFGPRKLPQMAKTIGKTMADFRRTTNDFKETWQKEVDFEEEGKILRETFDDDAGEKTIARKSDSDKNFIAPPEIKEIDGAAFDQSIGENAKESEVIEPILEGKAKEREREEVGKRDWL